MINKRDNVNAPQHYLKGNKETIEVIKDGMTEEEFLGYLKGNVFKYLARFRFKNEAVEDLEKAQWYLNKLIMETKLNERKKHKNK